MKIDFPAKLRNILKSIKPIFNLEGELIGIDKDEDSIMKDSSDVDY